MNNAKLWAGGPEPLLECDTCGDDHKAEKITEVRRLTPGGKWFYERQCVQCAVTEAEEKAEELAAVQSIKPGIAALLDTCEAMTLDQVYERLQDLSVSLQIGVAA